MYFQYFEALFHKSTVFANSFLNEPLSDFWETEEGLFEVGFGKFVKLARLLGLRSTIIPRATKYIRFPELVTLCIKSKMKPIFS